MDNGLAEFFEDPFMRRGAEPPVDLALTFEPMGGNEARRMTDEAVRDMQSGFRKLLDIKRREGWRALGYGSWKSYVENEFATFRQSIDRKVEAEMVREELDLADAPVSALKLGDSHLLLLADVKGVEAKKEIIERAKKIAENAPEPTGMAARYHKKGKITTAHIKQAIEDVQQFVAPNAAGEESIDWMFSSGKESLDRLRQESAAVRDVQQFIAPTPEPTGYTPDPADPDEGVIARWEEAVKRGEAALLVDKIDTAPSCLCLYVHDAATGKKFTLYLERYML